MNRTPIEWAQNPDGTPGYTWNPITGCLNHIDGICKGGGFPCYAYGMATTRLKEVYLANKNWDTNTPLGYEGYPNLDPFYPRFWPDRLDDAYVGKTAMGKPKGIFVCDMSDLFGIGIPENWTRQIFNRCRMSKPHRFYLLTKQPQNLIKFDIPDNCRVGVTVTDQEYLSNALLHLIGVDAKVKFLSFEPLLGEIGVSFNDGEIQWLIIGACTSKKRPPLVLLARKHGIPEGNIVMRNNVWTLQPKIEWVREIVEAADKAGIPVFLKDNLKPLFRPMMRAPNMAWWGNVFGLRQEMPK